MMTRTIALCALCACSTLDDQASLEVKDATFELVGGKLQQIQIDLVAWGPPNDDALMLFQYAELASTGESTKQLDMVVAGDFAPGTDRVLHAHQPSALQVVDAGTSPSELIPFCGTSPWWLIVCIEARQNIDDHDHQTCAMSNAAVVTCN